MKRKLIILIALLVSLAALTISGASLAYFTDTKKTENVYTAGNVYIELSEAAVTPDAAGNLIKDTAKDRVIGTETGVIHNYGKIYPGQTIDKDPLILNTGSEDAWIAAKVTLTDGAGDIHKLLGEDGDDNIDFSLILDGGIIKTLFEQGSHFGNWNGIPDTYYTDSFAIAEVSDRINGEYELYFFVNTKLQPGESVTVFDTFRIPAEWNNGDIYEMREFKITVEAFAVQSFGFSSCYDAMTTAFSDHFHFT